MVAGAGAGGGGLLKQVTVAENFLVSLSWAYLCWKGEGLMEQGVGSPEDFRGLR